MTAQPNPLPCGCRVSGTLWLPSQAHNLHVQHCPLHESAAELLAACEAFITAWEKSLQLEKTDVALRMAKLARAKARGTA